MHEAIQVWRDAWAVMLSVCILGPGVIADTTVSAQEGAELDNSVQGQPASILASPEGGTSTFHAYPNLIQLPVLVLGPNLEMIEQVDVNKFRVSFDGGPQFKVTLVRKASDDPVSLAVLLDLRGTEDELMQKMDAAMAGLAPVLLNQKDRVWIYALDCTLVRSVNGAIADKAVLEAGVDALLPERLNRKREKRKDACKDPWHYWDALGAVVEGMSEGSGRKVVLAVTNGDDQGGHYTWSQITVLAESKGVAVFGIEDRQHSAMSDNALMQRRPDVFDVSCQLSGGLVMKANPNDLAEKVAQIMKMVRGRYILEFPRPYNATAGYHRLRVTIEKSDDFIRPAGISFPVMDPVAVADPMTVPTDPSRTPQEGERRSPQKP